MFIAPLIIIFLLPPTLPPFILAQVIPTPVASIPDSDIVTAAPTFIVFLNVDTPATSKIPVLTLSVAAIPVRFDPSIAGNVPVMFAAGTFVKLAPDPLNVVAVTIPARSTPVSAKVTVPSPLRFSILLTLISDAIWVHFPPLF